MDTLVGLHSKAMLRALAIKYYNKTPNPLNSWGINYVWSTLLGSTQILEKDWRWPPLKITLAYYSEVFITAVKKCLFGIINYNKKDFIVFVLSTELGRMLLNFLQPQVTNFHNKQECLSLASLPALFSVLW